MTGFATARARVLPLTILLVPVACNPGGGSTSEGGSSDSGSTTTAPSTGPGPTSAGTSTSTDAATGTTDGPADGTSTTTDTTGTTDASSSDTTAGIEPFDVPFFVLDPVAVPLPNRVQPGLVVFTSAAEWSAATEAPVPAGVDFDTQWLIYGSHGPLPFPGHDIEVSTLTWDAGMLVVDGTAGEPDLDCETFVFTWPADTLLAIDALEVELVGLDDQTVATPIGCAAGGTESASCDLDAPCATGLLCGGLIRSTVLLDNPSGLCLPSSFAGTFTGPGGVIPADESPVEFELLAMGLATVDMDVVVWVQLDHPAPEELIIELRNPSANMVPVATSQTSPLHPGGVGIVPTGFSGDESVNGSWTLVVQDAVVNGNNGSVLSWELEIMSRLD